MRVRNVTRALLALVIGLTLLPAGVHAQGETTTGQIRGRVLDQAGEPIPGVSVIATNTQTGLERGAVTSENGLYVVRLLPPGIYDVQTQVLGYAAERVEDVRVVVGSTSTTNFNLAEEAIELEGLEIVAGPATINTREAAVVTTVTRETIEELPSLGRDFTDFINLSGMVSPDPGETTGGQFSIAGTRPSQTSIQIDGVDANNAFFGENRGGSRIPFVFSLESIREFQVVTNGYDVEYGNYAGGVVNVVTRGGTNEFEGSVYANYRSDALTAAPFGAEDDPSIAETDYETQQFSASFSGPIVRDEAFFLFSVDGQRRREPQLPITPQRFAPDAVNADPVVHQGIQDYLNILETQYGISNPEEGYQPFETTNDVLTLFGRVDWNINNDHRLSVRHNYATFSNDDEWNGNFDFIYGQSRAEEYEDVSHSFVTELQSVLGANTFNVARFQYASEDRPRQGKDVRPALTVRLTPTQRIGYGGTFASFQNLLEESKFQFINNFTHVRGDHTLKVGANVIRTNIFNRFILEGAGEYVFNSIEDFENFRPASYERSVTRTGEVPTSDFDVTEWGIYAQDEWVVTPKLTATLGLRYDQQSFEDAPGRVIPVENAFGFRTGKAPTDSDNISPRLSLAYDVEGDGSSVVRAGAGYFYGRVPYVLGGNVASTTQPALQLECGGDLLAGDPDAPPLPNDYAEWSPRGDDNPFRCLGSQDLSGVPEYTFWHDDFEFPETFKASLGYEQLVGESTTAGIDLIFSRSTKLYTVRNLNLGEAEFQIEAEAGRRVFQPVGVFDPAVNSITANEQNSRVNLDFGPVYMNYNDGRSQSLAASFELGHVFDNGARLSGSYTYMTAQDNSSYSCCTAGGGYEDPRIGVFGPNDIGGFGAEDRAWGTSDFVKNHVFVLYGHTELPFDVQLSGTWRWQSGRPWTPEQSGDLNGDGVRFNDRPYIFSPEDLPLAAAADGDEATAVLERLDYARILSENECIGDHVGGIVPRNTCRYPSYNRLDLQLSKRIETFSGQAAEIQVDFFNVLNGLNSDWGQLMGIFAQNRNIVEPVGFFTEDGVDGTGDDDVCPDGTTQCITYEVADADDFAQEEAVGDNLQLQFQMQLGVKYYF